MDNYFEENCPEAKKTLDKLAKRFGEEGHVEELGTGRVRRLKQLCIFGEHSPQTLFNQNEITEDELEEYNKAIMKIRMEQGPNTNWYSWRYWLDDWVDIDNPKNVEIRDSYFGPLDVIYPPMEMDVKEYRKEKGLVE